MNFNTFAAFCVIYLGGCTPSADIENHIINDRVKACSAGFSESTRMGLDASLNKLALSGGINGEVKNETRSIIFSEVPEEDRVKVYEDYISCIEKHWN